MHPEITRLPHEKFQLTPVYNQARKFAKGGRNPEAATLCLRVKASVPSLYMHD
jgi:hypothetical protein